MTEKSTEWTDLRRIADELELKIHLASMDAHDRWKALQPRLDKLEKTLAQARTRASKLVTDEVSTLRKALCELRDDVARDAK
ncbi:MAG TPA: hypothetical protein VFD36_07610 [Kofleriaceae bacterium]|nr:hypothetical protein [Kofleriaceae bacterium]